MKRLIARVVIVVGLLVFIAGCGGGGDHNGNHDGAHNGDHGDATLVARNQSSVSIYYLYVSPSTSPSWGPDQLGTRILDPGETFQLDIILCDRDYDLKAEYADHVTAATRFNVFFECSVQVNWTLFD